jgi:hypothetical protein
MSVWRTHFDSNASVPSAAHHRIALVLLLGALVASSALQADSIAIPNASFESPSIGFVTPNVDSWQKAPKPPDYDDTGTYRWDELVGIFKNTPPGASDHLINCDGNQAAWLFAVPDAGMFQDHDTTDWRSDVPSHEFNAIFEVGKAYHLTVALLGGGGNMLEGAAVELALYYRDASSNQVTVASTMAVNSAANFPGHTNLVDFAVHVPFVKAGDAWAGQNIGIRLRSVVSQESAGGYWDVDNVRLTAETAPALTLSISLEGSNLHVAWPSIVGYQYQMKVTEDWQTWREYDAPLAGTGAELQKSVPIGEFPAAFFGVQSTPTP